MRTSSKILGLLLMALLLAAPPSLGLTPDHDESEYQNPPSPADVPPALVAQVNRLIRANGNRWVKADQRGLSQQYWYLKKEQDWYTFYEVGTRWIAWGEIARFRLECPGSTCWLEVKAPWAFREVEIVGLKSRDQAERLRRLIRRLGKIASRRDSD